MKHHLAARRGVGFVAALVLTAAPLAIANAAFAADPSAQSTASVATGAQLRTAWADSANTAITLTADIDLGDAGCGSGEPVRSSSDSDAITIDGQGLFGITQTCADQRVLRDSADGETVTLTGLTHFTGGHAIGHGGGLYNNGSVVVVSSDVSGNVATATGPCDFRASDAQSQIVPSCQDGDGGGIFAGFPDLVGAIPTPPFEVSVTDSVVSGNTAADDGGGVYSDGTIAVVRSQVDDNVARGETGGGGRGGGAYAGAGAAVTDSTFAGNDAQCGVSLSDGGTDCLAVASGGGFFSGGSATVDGSEFRNNHAYDSGGGFFAPDAVVTSSTFTGNQAGGESMEVSGASASQLPAPVAAMADASSDGSENCNCVGGGFAVGINLEPAAAVAPEGGAQVTGSSFVGNGAGCNDDCFGSGGGFFAGNGAVVSGSTFGDGTDDGSNAAGCFEACGAMGGGFFAGGDTLVDTSRFLLNGVGCLGLCNAEGGGFFSGNGLMELSRVSGLADRLPTDAKPLATGDGVTRLVQSTLTANEAGCIFFECGGSGGGFFASTDGTVEVTASTLDQNDALFDGGAFAVNGGVGATVCAAQCGPSSDTTVTNSTITGNSSGFPAAISVPQENDTLTLVNDTIDSNVLLEHAPPPSVEQAAPLPGAAACECFAANVSTTGTFTSFGTVITHPIFQQEESTALAEDVVNCWSLGDVTSEGFNFSDDDSCGFTQPSDDVADGNDPMLGALADNGGPTQTMLPQPGSPLIDLIRPVSECQVDVDQRGVSRPQLKGCDTGAVEVEGASLAVDKVVTGTLGNPVPAAGYSFAVSCTDGSSATLSVSDATSGGASDTLSGIVPGATCTVTEAPVAYTNPNVVVQPVVTYDPVAGAPLGEGETEVVTVTNDYTNVNLLGIAVNITPKFTG